MTDDPRKEWDRDIESLEEDPIPSWRTEELDPEEVEWVIRDLRPPKAAPADKRSTAQ
jgi:hypothetical protein